MQLTFAACLWLYVIFFEPSALKRMIRWPLAIFTVMILLFTIIMPTESSVPNPSIADRYVFGGMLLVRSLSIIAVLQVFATRVSVLELKNLFVSIGIPGFGFVIGIAFHLLPLTHKIAHDTKNAMCLRGGFRRKIVKDSRVFLDAMMIQLLGKCDIITASAKTRAYRPENRYGSPPRLNREDAIVITTLGIYFIGSILMAFFISLS